MEQGNWNFHVEKNQVKINIGPFCQASNNIEIKHNNAYKFKADFESIFKSQFPVLLSQDSQLPHTQWHQCDCSFGEVPGWEVQRHTILITTILVCIFNHTACIKSPSFVSATKYLYIPALSKQQKSDTNQLPHVKAEAQQWQDYWDWNVWEHSQKNRLKLLTCTCDVVRRRNIIQEIFGGKGHQEQYFVRTKSPPNVNAIVLLPLVFLYSMVHKPHLPLHNHGHWKGQSLVHGLPWAA